MPHELYLTHWFAGPLDLSSVTAVRTESAPPGARADEVVVVLRGKRCIGTFQFSASCQQNRRTLTIQGTTGRIAVDMLSDFASLSTQGDSKLKRAVGGAIIEAGKTLLRAAPDRGRYGIERLAGRESPHLRSSRRSARACSARARSPRRSPRSTTRSGSGTRSAARSIARSAVRNCSA